MQFIKELIQFIKDVANDSRIPPRDKKVVLALVVYIISPVDLIPDWIPLLGALDDIIVLAIILDYFFDVLDQDILLSHFPWNMKKFTWIRRVARTITFLTPSPIKKLIWKFESSPYRK